MLADIELTGVVADNDGVRQKTMRLDAAPQGALGGDRHGIWAQSRDAQPVEMGVPRRAIGEDAIGMLGQAADDVKPLFRRERDQDVQFLAERTERAGTSSSRSRANRPGAGREARG